MYDRDEERHPREPDLILELDRDAVIRFASQPFSGASLEDLVGTNVFDHFDSSENARGAFHDVVTLGQAREVVLARWRARLVPLMAHEGAVARVLVIATETPGSIETQEHIQRAQRLETLGNLTSGIAHDFNNLLTGILGSASLAAMKLPPDSPASEQISRVVAAAEKAAELTNRMLAFSGKGRPRPAPSDLNQIVDQILPLVRSSLGRTIALHLALAPNLPLIEADALQIQQLVVSLLTPAAETRAREVFLRTGAMAGSELGSAPSVFLEIKDDGAGLDVGRPSLAAVEAIVRSHRGKLRVESAPNRGTCFTVSFPATRPAPAALIQD